MLNRLIRASVLLVLTIPTVIFAQTIQFKSEGLPLQVEKIASNLDIPWGMTFINHSEIIFSERSGKINVLDVSTGTIIHLKKIDNVWHSGQGGLLDVASSPDFKNDGWIYFTYSKNQQGQGVTTLARARLNEHSLSDWNDLVITRSATETDRHFGSRIAFDGKGHLFFTVGDRGYRPNGQDLKTHAGSVLRVNMDGSVPGDNPFVNQTNALPEIWSFGHRNPQGIAYDQENHRLWTIEHGPRGGDEINLIQPGKNYGWAVISHGKEYWGPVQVGEGTEKPGMEQPAYVYIPSIAPGSLLFYSGKAIPQWKGNLLAGALKLTHLNRIVLDINGRVVREERYLEEMGERLRALVESPQGWIYFSTDSGNIFRIRPG